ncbi:histidine--tRNA ligase [Convivina intestini]|uniref:Histidine--tRNA ligase n=1 Tax=Convivina intestini TaxID=1505726 RepID=A0A2U1DFT6_9LACO|nr:histidine--tRNA ligase [Convivina intestini]PVY86429.1 histidyl-tRNA synthetase [Convivina intestini]CAH1850342.1 Histidine--tRNA ligase [Convivina intestini]SDB83609.1 histidyl-tRNA synthetase [Leuconostocaceae bacterium R-53105]
MAKTTFQRPKGTADILPDQVYQWQKIEAVARTLFDRYGFGEIRTPIFENFEVFARSAGDTSDVVTKEMYDFHDKGDRHMALRPEGTAGVVRAYCENKLYGPEHEKPYKVFYMGPMFRYERPQAGRFRQFHQIGAEAFGSDSPALDVEMIAMVVDYLKNLGLKNLTVAINSLGDAQSRAQYRQALIDYLKPHFDELSSDSQTRLEKNPLRVLDSKAPQDQAIVAQAPSILDFLSPASVEHWQAVQALLDQLNISYEIDSSMVRGLDYYNDTIFEIMTNDESLSGAATIAGGGRYSGLVEEFGGPATPGVGFAIGVERLISLLAAQGQLPADQADVDFYVVNIGDEAQVASLAVTQQLRHLGYKAQRDYLDRSAKAQFKSANRTGARFVITIGASELEKGVVALKNMASGQQHEISLNELTQAVPTIMQAASQGE